MKRKKSYFKAKFFTPIEDLSDDGKSWKKTEDYREFY